MKLTSDDIRRAEARMQERMRAGPRATAARYNHRLGCIVVALSSGVELRIPVRLAQGLARASASDLREIEISPSGMGLHWPKLDADLHVPALFMGLLGSRRWMAHMLGQAGGRATSPAKRAAARANGRLGGRPRKEAPL